MIIAIAALGERVSEECEDTIRSLERILTMLRLRNQPTFSVPFVKMNWILLLAAMLLMACKAATSMPTAVAPASAAESTIWRVEPLADGWAYASGSSPRLRNGDWLWAQPEFDDGSWQRGTSLGLMPASRSAADLWIRREMTGPVLTAPLLTLQVNSEFTEAYLNGRRLDVEVLPYHARDKKIRLSKTLLIRLHPDYAGQVLSIHLQAADRFMGIQPLRYIGEPIAVMMTLIRNALPALLLATIVAFLAIGALALFLVTRKDVALLDLSLICFGTGLYVAGLSIMPSLLIHTVPPVNTIAGCAACLIVAGMLGFTRAVLDNERLWLFRWLQYLLFLDAFVWVTAPFVGREVPTALNNLLFLILAILIIGTVVRFALRGHIDAKIICCGLIGCWLLASLDMLRLVGLWNRPSRFIFIQSGLFFYILSLGLVLIRRFMQTHRQLQQYSDLLSEQVRTLERRNTEIQNLNGELRRQIELRSDRMIELLSHSRSGSGAQLQPLTAGQLLTERYRVIQAIGKGGMGSVYAVERTSDGLQLAAKLLSAQAERSATIRFIHEARILAKLHHPNLVTILDIDISSDGELFLVMELVKGSTLKDAVNRYADLGFVWSVLHQISKGLQAIHAQRVIHRDLKPANVLLTESAEKPQVKIADFGISTMNSGSQPANSRVNATSQSELLDDDDDDAATADVPIGEAGASLDAEQPAVAAENVNASRAIVMATQSPKSGSLTQTGVVLGTPLYMAPELAAGSRNAVPASDIFSFGIIAFEMLTGRLPFSVPPVIMVWNSQPLVAPELGAMRPDLPPPVLAALKRCLDPDPVARPKPEELIFLFGQAPPPVGTSETAHASHAAEPKTA